jgi:type I restriction enzyme S subunit
LVFIGKEDAAQLDHVTVQPDDVLFNITGASIGRVTTAPADVAGARVNQHVCILRTTDALVPQFLAYYMATPAQQAMVDSNQTGGTRQAVTKAILLEWPVPLPAPKEQRRIVDLLEQADGLRRQRAEADALAGRILPALFHKMFGDPATNPKGWPVIPLGDLTIRVTKGESPGWQGFQYQDEGPIFVTSENVRWGSIDLSHPKHIPLEFHQKLERSALREKDVLINLVGASIGRSCIVPQDIGEANVNQAVAVITCGPRLLPEYFASLVLTPAAQARFHGGKVEAARANISLNDVRKFPTLLPPMKVQKRFINLERQTADILQRREIAHRNIGTLFNVLLHRAFTQELTAKWREAHLKELLAEMEHQAKLLNQRTEVTCP